jgi:hypothetical protein
MASTNFPDTPVAIALHDRALGAERAAPTAFRASGKKGYGVLGTVQHHDVSEAHQGANRVAVLRRPRIRAAAHDRGNSPANIGHRTGFPPYPPSGLIVGTLIA